MLPSGELFERIHGEIEQVKIIDCHEHLQRESELPQGRAINLSRFFLHYANCDLVSAGMDPGDMRRMIDPNAEIDDDERWAMVKPWYERAWNTGYCEALRIAARDLYGVEDLTDRSVPDLLAAMRKNVKPGWTREVFDRADIDYAMTNPFSPRLVYNGDFDPACFICDMVDNFTGTPIAQLCEESGMDIGRLDDYFAVIDAYFERYADQAGAFKVGRAYDRTLSWSNPSRGEVEPTFNRIRTTFDRPDARDVKLLDDFIMQYLCRKCGEHGIRMKFHTGLQEGTGNVITNSRAALLVNLFLEYPKTNFDIYHISYPYQDELATLAKNFRNVTIDFCWMWIINPAAGRRALSEYLDTVPANQIHGFGGDYIFCEGSYGHAVIARREIARVLCEKVEEGRFTEAYAVKVGRMLLRDNAIENFGLEERRDRAIPAQREACAATGEFCV